MAFAGNAKVFASTTRISKSPFSSTSLREETFSVVPFELGELFDEDVEEAGGADVWWVVVGAFGEAAGGGAVAVVLEGIIFVVFASPDSIEKKGCYLCI